MTTAKKKSTITLSPSRDIPFNQLILSQSNVRRIKAGISVEELAEDIARRGILQGLTVRSVVDEAGAETGMFEVPAGGRRFRALELLVKQKRLAKTAPVPCVIREGGIAEEDSLAENIQRAPLHPLDQFRAFLTLREKGQSEEEIAATFFVSVNVVKQRLKLASVFPMLLDVYAEDGMTLGQLEAFTVSGDHERQEQVFERLKSSYDKSPQAIRRMLIEGAIRVSDKRTQFIGIDAYVEAGGTLLRDLFEGDGGGWLQDVTLVDQMVADKLTAEFVAIAAEGWKWTEVAPDFAYGHTYGLRRLHGEAVPLTAEQEAIRDALKAELDRLVEEHEGLLPPVVTAPTFSIRKPAVAVFTLDDYVAARIMAGDEAEALRQAVAARKNILVAGGTSTGKTTLTNALLAEVAKTSDRVVLIEDTRELQCAAPNLVALRTKDGVASLSDLVLSSLRLRPDRIPIGEVRGAEALDLLKAWGTGHPGGIGTIHAGSALGALRRMEQLIQEAVVTVPRALIAETIDVIAVLSGRGPARRLVELATVTGLGPTGDYQLIPALSSVEGIHP